MKKVIDNDFHKNIFTTMIDKEGKPIRVEVVSSALRSSGGEFLGTISVSRRIDEDMLLRTLHGIKPTVDETLKYVDNEEENFEEENIEDEKIGKDE